MNNQSKSILKKLLIPLSMCIIICSLCNSFTVINSDSCAYHYGFISIMHDEVTGDNSASNSTK
mgnify:FL=1